MRMRPVIRLALMSLVTCSHAPSFGAVSAEPATHYPAQPIRLIVPYPAGGGADHWGQLVGRKLAQSLGQEVVIDNEPGAGGNNGTASAAHAQPDGYTLLLGSTGPLAVHPFTYSQLAFRPDKDFVPVALLESSPILLVVASNVTAASAQDLIVQARSNPVAYSYASNGDGSPEEVAGELFKKRLNLEIRHVPFDGAAPARKAVLANQVSMMFDPCKGALPAVRQGLQRALAVATPQRMVSLPDVPTFAEAGAGQYNLRIWTGILVPAGTPESIITVLSQALRDILATTEIQQEIVAEGGTVGATTPAQFAAYIDDERSRWSRLVAESGVRKRQ